MASPISHAVAALSITACFYRPQVRKRVWALGVACTILPDLDVIGFAFGIHYGDPLGHRGFTHSVAFAAALATLVQVLGFRQGGEGLGRAALWTYLFLVTASHGLLDALTDGGLGVAFFAPFDNGRYFFPWRPIRVSPIGIAPFFSERGLAVLRSEVVWVWLPAAVLAGVAVVVRRLRPHRLAPSPYDGEGGGSM